MHLKKKVVHCYTLTFIFLYSLFLYCLYLSFFSFFIFFCFHSLSLSFAFSLLPFLSLFLSLVSHYCSLFFSVYLFPLSLSLFTLLLSFSLSISFFFFSIYRYFIPSIYLFLECQIFDPPGTISVTHRFFNSRHSISF